MVCCDLAYGKDGASDTESYMTKLEVQSYSPTQSIKSFTDDWNETLQSGDYAFAQGRLRMSMDKNNWRYGLNWRYDYMLQFTEDSAQIYWLYHNKKRPVASKTYHLNVAANHSNRAGFSIGKSFNFSAGTLSLDANVYKSTQFVDGDFSGDLTTKAAGDLSKNMRELVTQSNAFLNYYYHTPQLKEEELEWRPREPDGYGASLDVLLDANITPNLSMQVAAYDLLGFINWQDTPNTKYYLRYDEFTRPPYDLEGKLNLGKHKQTIPWHIDTRLAYQFSDDAALGVDIASNDLTNLTQLSARKVWNVGFLNTPLVTDLIFEPQTHSMGLSLKHKHISVKYLTDTFDTNKAKRADIALAGHFVW